MANRFLTTGSVKRIEQRGVELEDGLGAPETVPVGSDGTEIAGVLGEVQANPTANTLLGRLKALETAFATLLAKLSTDPLPAGDNNIGNVDVVTMPNVIVGSSALPTGAATSAKQDALAALVGSVSDAAVTDPTLSGSEIALLKGLLKQMQGNGTGTLPVNVSGGVVISGDTTLAGTVLMRDATDPAKLAKVDANGNQLVTVSGSNIEEIATITVPYSKFTQHVFIGLNVGYVSTISATLVDISDYSEFAVNLVSDGLDGNLGLSGFYFEITGSGIFNAYSKTYHYRSIDTSLNTLEAGSKKFLSAGTDESLYFMKHCLPGVVLRILSNPNLTQGNLIVTWFGKKVS